MGGLVSFSLWEPTGSQEHGYEVWGPGRCWEGLKLLSKDLTPCSLQVILV
jgi:hypothetical protein